ncbi:MAG: hypothetical protein AAFQ94_05605 [Bacteroidota bacterium]
MQRIKKSSSLSKSENRVAPFNRANPFMELHKMEYKLKNIKQRYKQVCQDKVVMEKEIEAIENKMMAIMEKTQSGFTYSGRSKKNTQTSGSKLSY